jgi:hypothetical protein
MQGLEGIAVPRTIKHLPLPRPGLISEGRFGSGLRPTLRWCSAARIAFCFTFTVYSLQTLYAVIEGTVV